MPGPSPKWHLSANHQPVGYLQVTGWCDHKKTGIPLTREAADAPWKDEHGVIREPRLWKEPG